MQSLGIDLSKGVQNISVSFNNIVPNIPRALLFLLIGIIIVKLIGRLSKPMLKLTRWPIGLQEIMQTIIRFMAWAFLAIAFLQIVGLSSLALALTGSVAVLAIGFSSGLSGLVADLVAGLQLANDRDFKVGYMVIAGDRKTEGVIRELDIKKVRIEDADGHIHVIPNSVVEKNEWTVLGRHVHSKMPTTSAIMKKAKQSAQTIKQKVSNK
jgi:small-conductance mechanosensitive channel